MSPLPPAGRIRMQPGECVSVHVLGSGVGAELAGGFGLHPEEPEVHVRDIRAVPRFHQPVGVLRSHHRRVLVHILLLRHLQQSP